VRHELWADVGDAHTRCRRCRTQYDVGELKSAMLRGAEYGLYKVADLLRLLDRYGHRIPRATLYRRALTAESNCGGGSMPTRGASGSPTTASTRPTCRCTCSEMR
jgi:hypothetical protein